MRKPQYTKDHAYRIVSVPNDLWRLQKGGDAKGTRTFDPWTNCGPVVEFSTAMDSLARQPLQGKVGVA